MRKRGIGLGAIGLVAGAIATYKAAQHFFNTGFVRQQKNTVDPVLPESEYSMSFSDNKEELHDMNIVSHDGLQLHGLYIDSPIWSNTVMILVHGYRSSSKDMYKMAKYFLNEYKFNVLIPDCRGHGESEGEYIGFGIPDRYDLLSWIHHINKIKGEQIQIVLYGISMGGATVCMASQEKQLPSNVKCIIEDCGYDSLEHQLSYRLRKDHTLPKFPLLNIVDTMVKRKAGYSIYEGNVVEAVRKSKTPILFIHGLDDHFVPTKMVYRLYNACKSEKELLLIKDAKHGECFYKDDLYYHQTVKDFMKRYVIGI